MSTSFKVDSKGLWIHKDPDAALDYSFDWSLWLGTDTIFTTQWTVPAGLTLGPTAHLNGVATAWLSGGTAGVTYEVACKITTAEGRIDTRRFRVVCVKR